MEFIDLKQFYNTLASVLMEDGKSIKVSEKHYNAKTISLEAMVNHTEECIMLITADRYHYYKFLHLMGYDNADFIKMVIHICGVDRISDLSKLIGKDIRKDIKKVKHREPTYDLYTSELGEYGISPIDLLGDFISTIRDTLGDSRNITINQYTKENPHIVVSVVYNSYDCFKNLCDRLGTSPPETIKLTTSLLGVTSRTMSNKVKKCIKNDKEKQNRDSV